MTADGTFYVQLIPDSPLPDIMSYAPFKAVVVIEATYSPEWQDLVSRWLVDSGCRYMLAWGPDCSSWDDSVDQSVVMSYPEGVPDDAFVMTTWHDNETLENVFWQAQFNAQFSYDGVELANTIIVNVSDIDREQWMRALFQRSRSLAERDLD